MVTFFDLLLIFIGGGLGALSRFGVTNIGWFDHDKYYYTVAVNISGCIVIGVIWALFQHFQLGAKWYLFAITGFLGGYTTYSAFTLDAIQLVQAGMWLRAIFYICITMIGGLGGCYLGLYVTERLLR